MRVRQAAIATSLLLLLSSGCSQAQNPLGFMMSAGQKEQSWNDVLDEVERDDTHAASDLRGFRARMGASATQKQGAAYVLGRLIMAHPELADATSPAAGQQVGTKAGALDEAISLFNEAAKMPALREKAIAHAIDCATQKGDEPMLRELLGEKLTHEKEPVKQAGIEYALAQSLLRTQEYDSALPLLTKIRTKSPESNYAQAAGYYLADAALSGHNDGLTPPQAVDMLRNYVHKVPDGRFARDAMNKLKAIASDQSVTPPYVPTASDHEAFGQVCFVNGDYRGALSEWQQLSGETKISQRVTCLARTGQMAAAKQLLLDGLKADPTIAYATAGDIMSGPLTREQTRQLWLQILAAKPKHADTAIWNVAVRSESSDAVPLFKKLIAEYPTSQYAPESAWWLFWTYAKHAPKDAAAATTAVNLAGQGLAKYPDTRAGERLGYWLGKMHEAQKKYALASADYKHLIVEAPTSYYSYRAHMRLSVLPGSKPAAADGGEAEETAAPKPGAKDFGWATFPARKDAKPHWVWPTPEEVVPSAELKEKFGATVAELFSLRQFDECIDALPSDSGGEYKAALLAKDDQPLSAINTARIGLKGAAHPSLRWQMSYPLVYASTVKAEANAKNVDPFLAHALIREESRYYHKAISRSHALGLMQLLPSTAHGVAKRLGVPISVEEDFFKPEVNIKLGVDYLSYVLGRYNGNALMAVASYNGGPNAVKNWLKNHEESGIGDLDYFVENIPVRETRDYVRKVFGAYWNYLTIYGAYPLASHAHQSPLEHRKAN